tara:strand:- start:1 stop:156 length:156 start_codon:yes stop_codon:yes gene_type:complete
MIESRKNRTKGMLKRTLANVLKARMNCCNEHPIVLIICPKCESTIRVEELE